MKKIIAIAVNQPSCSSSYQFSLSDWIAHCDHNSEKKHVLKGFVDVDSKSPVVYIQPNLRESTNHSSLLSEHFQELQGGSEHQLREGVIGFQLRFKGDPTQILFNPSSNTFGSARDWNDVSVMWKALSEQIDCSGVRLSLYLKSKVRAPQLESDLKERLSLSEISNKQVFDQIQCLPNGTISHSLSRVNSFDSDSGQTLLSDSTSEEMRASSTDTVLEPIPEGDFVYNQELLHVMRQVMRVMSAQITERLPFALGNSLSWPLEIIGQQSQRQVGFIPFSGNCYSFDREPDGTPTFKKTKDIPEPNQRTYKSYLQTIGFTPSDIQAQGMTLFEYTETGRGLYTFLNFMTDWAMEDHGHDLFLDQLNIVVFQGNVGEGQTPAMHNPAFDRFRPLFIDFHNKELLQQFCDNEKVRLIPSHKVHEKDHHPETFHRLPLVQTKIQVLLDHFSKP